MPLLIAYTGFGNTVDRQRSIAAGFRHHLTKPVNIAQLLQILAAGNRPDPVEKAS